MFYQETADRYDVAGLPLERTTNLCIAAHQDDIEMMAAAPILDCYGKPDRWFTGVVVSNGAGSPRAGVYADFSDDEMRNIRRIEQRRAADIGEYLSIIQLDYTSGEIKKPNSCALVEDIKRIVLAAQPALLYTHNPFDKHPTHVAVTLRVLEALRKLKPEQRPKQLIGCEVWRGLDWLPDSFKIPLDTASNPNLSAALVAVYDSQISAGKRYDLATMGRRMANATYFQSHSVDCTDSMNFGLDLTELMNDEALTVSEFAGRMLDAFRSEVQALLRNLE